ncbi:SLC13 family permease [Paenibacillus sp. 1P07SE]|uniref:SLC13 family permease n=1 Tax=Paenibacillus sp. 1P07SE TaxID=3132209 RepID=UPI0039A69552
MEYTTTDQLLSGGWHWVAATILFVVAYFAGITEKFGRAAAALGGAVLLLILGIVEVREALASYIVWDALLLLAGMMLLTGLLGRTGVFMQTAVRTVALAQGRPVPLLALLMLLGALLSAFLDQLGTILLLVPIALTSAHLLRISAFPFLAGIIVSSNIGGTATLVGNAANMLIGTSADLSFLDFIRHLGPVLVVILLLTIGLFIVIFRSRLKVTPKERQQLLKQARAAGESDKSNRYRIAGWIVLLLVTAGFMLHDWLNVPPYAVAWAGAIIMLVAGAAAPGMRGALQLVEWNKLAFLAGLLVIVGGLEQSGVIHHLAGLAMQITEGDGKTATQLTLWTSALVSAAADQLPYVAAAIPLVDEMGSYLDAGSPLWTGAWWSLALGAGLGANATLLGSSSSIVAAGMAAKEGKPFSFLQYCALGLPVAVFSLTIASFYLYYFYT